MNSSAGGTSPHEAHENSFAPFRRAVVRGLGVVLPPLLTFAIFAWIWGAVHDYVLDPLESLACNSITYAIREIHADQPIGGGDFVATASGDWIPRNVRNEVVRRSDQPLPKTGWGVYREFVRVRYLKGYLIVPAFLSLFVFLLYLLGKFIAAGVGRFAWKNIEYLISALPIIRTVYSAVKQVTDLLIKERDNEVEYRRVVAVEYPRRGCWSVGFVTGESLLAIEGAAGEPVLSLLMPTSPMPATGFTITVRRTDTIDLDISMDQALQFVLSCGVVTPIRDAQDARRQIQSTVATQLNEISPPSMQEEH